MADLKLKQLNNPEKEKGVCVEAKLASSTMPSSGLSQKSGISRLFPARTTRLSMPLGLCFFGSERTHFCLSSSLISPSSSYLWRGVA